MLSAGIAVGTAAVLGFTTYSSSNGLEKKVTEYRSNFKLDGFEIRRYVNDKLKPDPHFEYMYFYKICHLFDEQLYLEDIRCSPNKKASIDYMCIEDGFCGYKMDLCITESKKEHARRFKKANETFERYKLGIGVRKAYKEWLKWRKMQFKDPLDKSPPKRSEKEKVKLYKVTSGRTAQKNKSGNILQQKKESEILPRINGNEFQFYIVEKDGTWFYRDFIQQIWLTKINPALDLVDYDFDDGVDRIKKCYSFECYNPFLCFKEGYSKYNTAIENPAICDKETLAEMDNVWRKEKVRFSKEIKEKESVK